METEPSAPTNILTANSKYEENLAGIDYNIQPESQSSVQLEVKPILTVNQPQTANSIRLQVEDAHQSNEVSK
jgi:hypothetical protein